MIPVTRTLNKNKCINRAIENLWYWFLANSNRTRRSARVASFTAVQYFYLPSIAVLRHSLPGLIVFVSVFTGALLRSHARVVVEDHSVGAVTSVCTFRPRACVERCGTARQLTGTAALLVDQVTGTCRGYNEGNTCKYSLGRKSFFLLFKFLMGSF